MPFYFYLGRQDKKHQLANNYVQGSVKKQYLKEDHIKKWVSGESRFNKQKYLKIWEKYRKDYGDTILLDVLKTMAISNAIVDVNHILQYNMAMPEAVIDKEPVFKNLSKIFNVAITQRFLGENKITSKAKEEILYRLVATEFPLKHERQMKPMGLPPINLPPILPRPQSITRGEK